MDCITFDDVSFTYPDSESGQPVFEHFSGAIPGSFTSLVGPNGTGKTTFMMLASGRLVPQQGKCLLLGQDVARLGQEQKNLLASVIYQNMEFESDQTVQELLAVVYSGGSYKAHAKAVRSGRDLFDEVTDVFEVQGVMQRGLTQLSKGEIQRVLLAFSILYGSATLFMDEPLFAMEERQKKAALSYLVDFCRATKTPVFVSMHELELTRQYAKSAMLFYPDRTIEVGTPDEVLTASALEKAYGVPAAMLKHSEDMTREQLQNLSQAAMQMRAQA